MRHTVAIVLLGVLLASCGDASVDVEQLGATSDAVVDTDQSVDTTLAALGIITPGVAVADTPQDVDAATFRDGEDGEGLVDRDLVRTDDVGYAEIRWFDGAVARVDVDSLFAVTTLDLEADAPVIQTRLDVGRVWNRLDRGRVDSYEVDTAVGTAAVRGTAFVVGCTADGCMFGVAEGVVEITTILGIVVELRAGEQVDVNADGQPGEIQPYDPTEDVWTMDNLDRDEAAGFPAIEVAAVDEDRPDEDTARLEGTYAFDFTVDQSTQPGGAGLAFQRTYVFTPTCATGPCGGDWDTGGAIQPYTWTGEGHAMSFVRGEAGPCPDGSGSRLEDFRMTLTTTQVDDQGRAAAVTAAWENTLYGCDGEEPVTQVVSGSGVRQP